LLRPSNQLDTACSSETGWSGLRLFNAGAFRIDSGHFDVEVTSTMTSCGYGVPVMEFARDRKNSDRGRQYKDR